MNRDSDETADISQQEFDDLKALVRDMKPKVDKVYDVLFNDDHEVETREGIDDIRLMRQIYQRFKSARFLFGAIAGVLTFLATVGYAGYKIVELVTMLMKSKGG